MKAQGWIPKTKTPVSVVQCPLWFLEGIGCESQTAYWQLLPPLERCSPVPAVAAPATRRPIGGSAVQQTLRVGPGKSCSPYRFVWINSKSVFCDSQKKGQYKSIVVLALLQWGKAPNCKELKFQKMLRKNLFQPRRPQFGEWSYL